MTVCANSDALGKISPNAYILLVGADACLSKSDECLSV